MPRLFVPNGELGGNEVTLSGEAHRYLARVLRLTAGADLVLFDGQGMEIDARLTEVSARSVRVTLGHRRYQPRRGTQITLLQAIAKGERMDWLVEKTTELGVARIVPVITDRSVARPGSGAGKARRWRAIATAAARQSGRAQVPTIDEPSPLGEALAALAARAQPAGRVGFVLWEEQQGSPLRSALATLPADTNHISLLVGPEGGLAREEVSTAEGFGFKSVGLGVHILRVDTAAVTGLALVQAATGALD